MRESGRGEHFLIQGKLKDSFGSVEQSFKLSVMLSHIDIFTQLWVGWNAARFHPKRSIQNALPSFPVIRKIL